MTFDGAADALPSPEVSIRQLLELIGEQGLLLFCVFLAVPFLLPVSIPGTSTVFGLLLLLVGAGVTANRVPWLPNGLLSRRLNSAHVATVLRKSAAASRRFEKLIRPRLLALTHGATLNRINGLMLVLVALLLMAPLPLFPFTNTAPAIAIVLLAVGMAERDGVIVIAGYVATAVATAYIGLLLYGVFWAGSGILDRVWEFLGN
ncbi:MAG: exopolysaccharide biosynthesis protein [Steroidobacteraceae bacterium]|nr:exopolysaccharide biosynthesis protein [Steroidobacteraceae bacterium]